MAVVVTITTATGPSQPNVIAVSGLDPATNVITIMRRVGTAPAETIGGSIVVDSVTHAASYEDYLYPFDTPVIYEVFDSTGQVPLGSATSGAVPSGGMPWIRDAVFPALRYVAVIIVDVTDRTRAGRISPYYVAAVPGAVTAGDVRSLSNGTLTLYARSHAERDAIVDTMSTGSPCQLRIPAACQSVVDEMLFAPLDIGETRYGTAGACLLTVDFLEVDPGELATFKPVTYGVQKTNAAAAGLEYGKIGPPATELALQFVGKTYRDMYLSPTGIEP